MTQWKQKFTHGCLDRWGSNPANILSLVLVISNLHVSPTINFPSSLCISENMNYHCPLSFKMSLWPFLSKEQLPCSAYVSPSVSHCNSCFHLAVLKFHQGKFHHERLRQKPMLLYRKVLLHPITFQCFCTLDLLVAS